jgi:hypothetical protein
MELIKFSPKDPFEIIPLTFPFGQKLKAVGEKISTIQVVDVVVYTGIDATAANILSGGATVVGDDVIQKVRQGVDGVEYLIRAVVVTVSGLVLAVGGILPIQKSGTY